MTIHGDADRDTAVLELEVKDDNAGLHLTGFQFVNALAKKGFRILIRMQIIMWLI